MAVINLFVDVQNQRLATSAINTAVVSVPAMFENNQQAFVVQFLQPQPSNPQAPFQILDVSGKQFRMSLGAQPLGNGSVMPVAIQTVWTWNAQTLTYSATLALNTIGLDTLIGANASIQCTFELNLVDSTSGAYQTILQTQVTLKAVLDSANTTAPTPVALYYTSDEIGALFVRKVGLAGELITMTSPDGNWVYTIGIDNTGTPTTNIAHT